MAFKPTPQGQIDAATELYGAEFTNKSERTKKAYLNAMGVFADASGIDPDDKDALLAMARQNTADGRTVGAIMGSPEVIDNIVENYENIDRARKKGKVTAFWSALATVLGGPLMAALGPALGLGQFMTSAAGAAISSQGARQLGAPGIVQLGAGLAGGRIASGPNLSSEGGAGRQQGLTPDVTPLDVTPLAIGGGGGGLIDTVSNVVDVVGKVKDTAGDAAKIAAVIAARAAGGKLYKDRMDRLDIEYKNIFDQEIATLGRKRDELTYRQGEEARVATEGVTERGFGDTPYSRAIQGEIKATYDRQQADVVSEEASAASRKSARRLSEPTWTERMLTDVGQAGTEYYMNEFLSGGKK